MTRTRYKHILLLAFDLGYATKYEPFMLASQVVETLGDALRLALSGDEVDWLTDITNSAARAMKNAIGDAYIAGRWGEYEQVD